MCKQNQDVFVSLLQPALTQALVFTGIYIVL